jgi:acetyl-CoA carboxylase alpha subunit
VWAEPETGGEAYIPLAPQKRGRSRQIADETVNRLGGRVEWAADGMLRGQQGGYGSTASQTRSFGPDDMRQALNGMKLALDVGGQRTLTTIIHAGAQTIVDAEADHNSAMRRSGRRPR